MLTLPASKAISSNHHLHKGSDQSSINLPEIKQTVQFTGSTKSVPKSESTNTNSAKRKFTKKGDKKEEFDPDKIAAAVRYAQLQAIFAADEDGLDIDEFKDAMRKTVGHRMTDTEIEFLFMKVDANCDEKVDWEEYVTYNLLEYQGKTLMIEMMRQRPLPQETTPIPSKHRESIVAVKFYPSIQKKAGKNFIDHINGKYVTLSKEGLMSTWNMNMKHLESYHVITDVADRATHPWMVDMACMYNVGMLALSSTDRDITLYDIHGNNCLKRYYLTGLDDCITCMDYWVNLQDLNHAIFTFGDTSGSVTVFVFDQCVTGGLFGCFGAKRNACKQVSVPEIIRGFFKGAKGYRFNKLHSDWVLQVKYVPELSSIVSCCQTTETSLCVFEFEKKRTNQSVFKINKGILCFDYCPENNILVTGGMDYWVRVWNPYVCSKAISVLKGHTKPISHVIINSRRNQTISIDKAKNIRVYDLKDQACLQQVGGRVVKLGKYSLSAAYFNPVLQTLIIATNQLAMLEKTDEEVQVAEIRSHNKPVVTAIYNKTFRFVVSACQDSVISVWDLHSGEKVIQTVNAHSRAERGFEVPVEITTMTFDGPQRRVITGARDGSVKVWNFNNGNCLQTFITPENMEVSGVVSVNNRIIVAGWSRQVHIFLDGGDEEYRKDWKQKHNEDILCMTHLSPNIIATGSYDGDIIVWSRDTGQLYCTLNASKGTQPIGENKTKCFEIRPEPALNEIQEDEISLDILKTFGSIANEEMMKMKTRKLSFLKQNKDILSRVKENVLLKENKWSRKLNRVDETQVDHPLLPLFHSQSPVSEESNKNQPSRREEYDELCKLYESAIECILFLESRDRENGETAIMMTSGAEGWVRAWSIHHQGGLIGQFNASHKVGESVHTMSTDINNKLLFTADSCGYVKIWDITEYCTRSVLSASQRASRWNYLNETFTYVRLMYCSEEPPDSLVTAEKRPPNIATRPPPSSTLPKITLKWPFLVNSFRAHTKIINKIEYVEEVKLLITASSDCAIRVWTLNGCYIGTFGEPWKSIPTVLQRVPTARIRIPSDLHRIGSSSTLKVLNQGRSGLWTQAIDAAVMLSRTKSAEEEEEDEFEMGTDDLVSDTNDKSDQHDKPRSAHSGRTKAKKCSGSEILGKTYKKTMRHRMLPTMDKFVQINSSISVFRCLPYSDLNLDMDPEQMKVLEDIRAKYYSGTVLSKLKGEPRKQEKGPALIGLFNKITNKPPLPKGKNQMGRIKRAQNKIQKKPDSVFADLKVKEAPHETDLIDKILTEGTK
ncbi:WD repeat-containing protein on Y chromosome-like [Mytilus galloprovincialis]|uniref:WD repeat-containing protein on Y chromosome-like n=1 Tax=Mytilus galloprovincialis TaxID=29158 RepID=UPI003F7BA0E9